MQRGKLPVGQLWWEERMIRQHDHMMLEFQNSNGLWELKLFKAIPLSLAPTVMTTTTNTIQTMSVAMPNDHPECNLKHTTSKMTMMGPTMENGADTANDSSPNMPKKHIDTLFLPLQYLAQPI